ncbi:MAG TPA: rod shape-determining protein MreC [Trebonia sp.]|jgi:rod shape-determining protein MreC|nr:rod shape-determining protein MreC [Trebonia sp.]
MLLVVAIALITLDFRDGGGSPVHTVGADVFGPVERVAGDAASPFVGFFHAASGNDSSEIAALQKQNDQLRAELAQNQVSNADAAQLASLLRLSGKHGYRVVAGTIIAAGGEYSDTVTINAGSADGVAPDETVLNGDGLVGTVTAVTSGTATVQLATDADATVGVRTTDTNQIGALSGTGQTMAGTDELRLTLFSATAVLHPGETLVTFGSVGGRPYVAGVPVGAVVSVTSQPGSLTQTALVRPFADFSGLGVLGVVVPPPAAKPAKAAKAKK